MNALRRSLLIALVAACGDSIALSRVEVASIPTQPSRQLDLLLQIDDSNSTAEIQDHLALAMPGVLDAISVVDGQLPDLHIGVITSDFGTTGSLAYDMPGPTLGTIGSGGCMGHGKDGALQVQAAAVSDAYIVDESDGAGHRTTNYAGPLIQTLSTMIHVGSSGCGFEQPLAATTRSFANPANAGFRRPGANLAVLILADEDDCSLRDPALLGPETAELGPVSSFRCTRFGVACDQPLTEVGTKTGCHAAVDSRYVDDIALHEAALRAQSPDPAKLVVGAIVGPSEPFAVELREFPGGTTPPTQALTHSCAYQDGSGAIIVADPAVRIRDLTTAFASHGTSPSGCASDLTSKLEEIARVIKQTLGVACLDTTGLAMPLDCTATEVNHVTGEARDVPLTIAPDLTACPETLDHLRALVTPTAASLDTHVEVRCR